MTLWTHLKTKNNMETAINLISIAQLIAVPVLGIVVAWSIIKNKTQKKGNK
jgi:ABC-type sulfate transport system permease subunit